MWFFDICTGGRRSGLVTFGIVPPRNIVEVVVVIHREQQGGPVGDRGDHRIDAKAGALRGMRCMWVDNS